MWNNVLKVGLQHESENMWRVDPTKTVFLFFPSSCFFFCPEGCTCRSTACIAKCSLTSTKLSNFPTGWDRRRFWTRNNWLAREERQINDSEIIYQIIGTQLSSGSLDFNQVETYLELLCKTISAWEILMTYPYFRCYIGKSHYVHVFIKSYV